MAFTERRRCGFHAGLRHRSRLSTSAMLLGPLSVLTGCHAFDDLAATGEATPSAARCGDCHVEIWREWQDSSHARAFASSGFLARTDGGRIERCLGCHAPSELPIELSAAPIAREVHRSEGVHCIACHRLPPDHAEGAPVGTMVGPLASHAAVRPHPIEGQETRFRDAAFCGRCHQDTYREWKESRLGAPETTSATCQNCHMPPVVRKVTQATGIVSRVLVAMEDEVPTRAHDFDARLALAATRDGAGIEPIDTDAVLDQGILRIRIHNRLPHSLPTGSFGRQGALIRVLLDGEVVVTRRVLAKRGRALDAGAEIELAVACDPITQNVELEITRTSDDGESFLILRRDIAPRSGRESPGSAEPRGRLTSPVVGSP